MKPKNLHPAVLIALLVSISFAMLALGHVITNKPLLFLDYRDGYGFDYLDFFQASENIIHNLSPYAVSNHRYITTPIPAIFNMVFVPLGFNGARIVLYGLIPLSLALGFFFFSSLYNFPQTNKNLVLSAGLVCLLFGYPFYFLVQRENIDGWVFLFLCMGLYFSQREKKEAWSSLFLSLAIAFKIYPILILLPFFIYKKWRLLLWIGVWLVLWGGLSSFWISDFQNTIVLRSQSFFRFDENGSLVATVALISILLNAFGISSPGLYMFSPIIAAILYGILYSIVLFVDYKLSKRNKYEVSSLAMYLPFMVALPQVVYHYSFVLCLILIPVICHLWEKETNDRQNKTLLLIMALGIALSQWQAFATYHLTNNPLAHIIPGLGLLILMVCITWYKILALRQTKQGSSIPGLN